MPITGTGGLFVFEALYTFHRKILCADRQYVTQNFDTKQTGRRIFEICVYRPGKFDAHTMTLRQDGGFPAERNMSQLATHKEKKNGQKSRGRARILPWATTREEKKIDAQSAQSATRNEKKLIKGA